MVKLSYRNHTWICNIITDEQHIVAFGDLPIQAINNAKINLK